MSTVPSRQQLNRSSRRRSISNHVQSQSRWSTCDVSDPHSSRWIQWLHLHPPQDALDDAVCHSLSLSLFVSMTTPCSFDGGVVNQEQPGPIHIEHCLAMWWEGNWGIIREEEKKRNEWCPSTRRYHGVDWRCNAAEWTLWCFSICDGQCVGMITCLHASVCASYLCHQSLFNDAIAVWPYSPVCYRTLCMRRYNRNHRLNL